jgi:hypothetical protein
MAGLSRLLRLISPHGHGSYSCTALCTLTFGYRAVQLERGDRAALGAVLEIAPLVVGLGHEACKLVLWLC